MMKGTSDEDSRIKMTMKANFVHTSQCNFDLEVKFSSEYANTIKQRLLYGGGVVVVTHVILVSALVPSPLIFQLR